MTMGEFNQLALSDAKAQLLRCCGSQKWAEAVALKRPYASLDALVRQSESEWLALSEKDWLEAFSHHPRIGAKVSDPVALQEQAGAQTADASIREALRAGNVQYQEKFGFVFLVCATGKSANEMLGLLQARLPRSRAQELATAVQEQSKITQIRLEKWLT